MTAKPPTGYETICGRVFVARRKQVEGINKLAFVSEYVLEVDKAGKQYWGCVTTNSTREEYLELKRKIAVVSKKARKKNRSNKK